MEKPALQPLPTYPYEYCLYQTVKVYNNSHTSYEKHYYSVPYAFIGRKVALKIYSDHLEVFGDERCPARLLLT
ncbi:Mu transposase domain-containing protein [Enterococcus sp. DIV0187]|uniref:Mu transposase domain-containing protein n=1 Tax=Enterococcus sp. DIV0187 TaxID=2774644 RepID=UPI003F6842C0